MKFFNVSLLFFVPFATTVFSMSAVHVRKSNLEKGSGDISAIRLHSMPSCNSTPGKACLIRRDANDQIDNKFEDPSFIKRSPHRHKHKSRRRRRHGHGRRGRAAAPAPMPVATEPDAGLMADAGAATA